MKAEAGARQPHPVIGAVDPDVEIAGDGGRGGLVNRAGHVGGLRLTEKQRARQRQKQRLHCGPRGKFPTRGNCSARVEQSPSTLRSPPFMLLNNVWLARDRTAGRNDRQIVSLTSSRALDRRPIHRSGDFRSRRKPRYTFTCRPHSSPVSISLTPSSSLPSMKSICATMAARASSGARRRTAS